MALPSSACVSFANLPPRTPFILHSAALLNSHHVLGSEAPGPTLAPALKLSLSAVFTLSLAGCCVFTCCVLLSIESVRHEMGCSDFARV